MSLTSIKFEEYDISEDEGFTEEQLQRMIDASAQQLKNKQKTYVELPWWKKVFRKQK